MALNNPRNPRGKDPERILLMGGAGAGKTRSWLSIADMARKTKSKARFFVIDTDLAAERMLSQGFQALAEDKVDGKPRVVVETPFDFPDYNAAMKKFKPLMGDEDWLVVDLISQAWEEVQTHYSEEVFGQEKGDYFLAARKAVQVAGKDPTGSPFEGWTDWNIIKPMYADFANKVFFKHKGHTLVCTGAQALNRGGRGKQGDPKELIQTFNHVGFRPQGEKRLAHAVHSVLYLVQRGSDTWEFTTGKDREREYVEKITMSEKDGQFVKQYLMGVAGWKLT